MSCMQGAGPSGPVMVLVGPVLLLVAALVKRALCWRVGFSRADKILNDLVGSILDNLTVEQV
jgi:hypothetical protein